MMRDMPGQSKPKSPEEIAKENAEKAKREADSVAWRSWYYQRFLLDENRLILKDFKDEIWIPTVKPDQEDHDPNKGDITADVAGLPRILKENAYYALATDSDIKIKVTSEKASSMTLSSISKLSTSQREEFYRNGMRQFALQGNLRVTINFPKDAQVEFIKMDEIRRMMRIAAESKLEVDFGTKIDELMEKYPDKAIELEKLRKEQNQKTKDDVKVTLQISDYYQDRHHKEIKNKTDNSLASIQMDLQDTKTQLDRVLNPVDENNRPVEIDPARLQDIQSKLDALTKRYGSTITEAKDFLESANTEARANHFKTISDENWDKIQKTQNDLLKSLEPKIADLTNKMQAKNQEILNENFADADKIPGGARHAKFAQLTQELKALEAKKAPLDSLVKKIEDNKKVIEIHNKSFNDAHENKIQSFAANQNRAP